MLVIRQLYQLKPKAANDRTGGEDFQRAIPTIRVDITTETPERSNRTPAVEVDVAGPAQLGAEIDLRSQVDVDDRLVSLRHGKPFK